MCNLERKKFIKELKRDIALKQKEARRQRFSMKWAANKYPYRQRLELCTETIEELKSRLQIHNEILNRA